MRKAQKQGLLGTIGSLHKIHEEIKKALEQGSPILAQDRLSGAQESAISLGEQIEGTEGEGHGTVVCIEEYCELLFQAFEEINKNNYNANRIYKTLRKQLIKIENSVKNDITVKTEIVFFPYKVSMWDSLESIYLAAEADPDCDVYCVPIPYYTLNPDHSFGEMHYEGGEYPENIRVTDWQAYDFEERKPDVIYIHNPYDDCNLVTSVPPRFYSPNLKKYTDTLVYVPYYSTSGGMSKAQSLCPAYIHVDYIVIQSPEFRRYFDAGIPDQKFLPFGSPKFDRIIKKCQNPPKAPTEWKLDKAQFERTAGRKLYFYNTSIAGMLADTESFLKKMDYVFRCFEGREDVCLLWRPHPLLEASFDSMRPQYRQVYDTLKQRFQDKQLGILDTTPDITDTVALSDAYIGDTGTSVTSLFGIAGKPIFILDNQIHKEPAKDIWREDPGIRFIFGGNRQFVIWQGDRLYVSEEGEYKYRYFCDLTDHTRQNHYCLVYEIGNKYYACPDSAQKILIIGEHGVEKIIELDDKTKKLQAFGWAWTYDKYLLLIPVNYPAVVRYDTTKEQIRYFDENMNTFVKNKDGHNIIGGSLVYRGFLYIASPTDNHIYQLNIESGEVRDLELAIKSRCGCFQLAEYKDELWLMPYEGQVVVCWNPATGATREYSAFPPSFKCASSESGYEGPTFNLPAFEGDYMYLAPGWANMYLKMNINTGEFTEWKPSFENESGEAVDDRSTFLHGQSVQLLYSYTKRKLYCTDSLERAEFREIVLDFDIDELKCHEPGFCVCDESSMYACIENYFNSLKTFLDNKIAGNQFDREKQLAAYKEIVSNADGSCGQKIHEFIREQEQRRQYD